MATRWTKDQAGCIFEGASVRTADELSANVVLMAMVEGRPTDDDVSTLAESVDRWCGNADDSDWLSQQAADAQDWLNEHVAPAGHRFEFEDGFYLWPLEAED